LQYLQRIFLNAKLEGVEIGQLWLVDKGVFDLYIKQTQDANDLPTKTLLLLFLFVNYCIMLL